MTPADWTAVGRRLTVGRPARRPPRSRLKSRHKGIVAPLAATVAALSVGLAAAALARRRRPPAQTPAEHRRSQLQDKTLKQLDLAIALLEGRGDQPPEKTVHEARKALKRARALVRLQRGTLRSKRFRRANRSLRDVGRRLAGARDAEVLVDALDRLVKDHPKQLAGSAAVASLRKKLVARRERLRADARAGAPARAAIVTELCATRAAFARWELREGRDIVGFERIYRQGRKRRRQARKANSTVAMHQWRKRVKDLRYAAEALGLKRVARRADRLGETIGEEHDLALLDEYVRRHRKCFKGEQATRRSLRKLIRRRRRKLRERAWRLGEELYRHQPKRFARRALGAHA
jgi:hypothetical protein